jgi:hypothetical protein
MAEPVGVGNLLFVRQFAGETTRKVILVRFQIPELIEDKVPFWEFDPFAIQLQGRSSNRKRTSGSECRNGTLIRAINAEVTNALEIECLRKKWSWIQNLGLLVSMSPIRDVYQINTSLVFF